MSATGPVGVFDSGVGGLSVAREIRARLPAEDILYFADTANCPYGGRSLAEIRALSLAAAEALVGRGAKIVVVACNTASGAALEDLRERLEVPVVGLEPALKPATEATRSGRVGVMATAATLRTERFERLVTEHAREVEVLRQACPGLVELVEAGELEGDRARGVLREILTPLGDGSVDTIVLGCTHYPFLRPAIQELLGEGVTILDSGEAVARQVERVLRESGRLADTGAGEIRLLTTGDPERVGTVAERLWGAPMASYSQVRSTGGAPSPGSSR